MKPPDSELFTIPAFYGSRRKPGVGRPGVGRPRVDSPGATGAPSRQHAQRAVGEEWLYFTKSVLTTAYPSELGHALRRTHGANKPPRLMARLIEFFTRPGELVLDPFAAWAGRCSAQRSLAGRVARSGSS